MMVPFEVLSQVLIGVIFVKLWKVLTTFKTKSNSHYLAGERSLFTANQGGGGRTKLGGGCQTKSYPTDKRGS